LSHLEKAPRFRLQQTRRIGPDTLHVWARPDGP
jgi:hypothetical protein